MADQNFNENDVKKLSEDVVILSEKEENLEKVSQTKNETQKEAKPTQVTQKKKEKANRFQSALLSWLSSFENKIFLGIFLVAFILRLNFIGQESIWNDAAVHLWYAIKVVQEPLFFFSQKYLMGDYMIQQTMMAILNLFTKDVFVAGKIIAMFYSMAGIVFMYLLGSELNNKKTGLIAATILTFNHVFWFYGVRVLADSPLLVTTIILLYCMVKLEKEKTMIWGILSGFMFLAAMFTKVQASLFVFALLIYYIIFKRKEMIKEKAVLTSWLIPVAFVLLAHIFGKILFGAAVLDRLFGLFLDTRGIPYGLEALAMVKWVLTWHLIPFVILGVFFVVAYKKKSYYFSIILMIFYYLFFEINVDNTQDRYVLPLLAMAIPLAVLAIEEISHFASMFFKSKMKKNIRILIVLVIVGLISFNYYSIGQPLIEGKQYSYVGWPEAGDWIRENVPEDTIIFAGSYRMARAFIGREIHSVGYTYSQTLGGPIHNLRGERYQEDPQAFIDDLNTFAKDGDVYVVIDVWEYTQPSWYWPINQESVEFFYEQGLEIAKVVEAEVATEGGIQKSAVIFIFKKEQIQE